MKPSKRVKSVRRKAVNPTHQHAEGCAKLYGGKCDCIPVPLTQPKLERMEWGVVLTKCVNKKDAQLALASMLMLDPEIVIYKPVVRRLPMLPATRKEK